MSHSNKSEEMYLETLYTIIQEKGHAHVVDVASALDVKKSSVIKAMTKCKNKGYIIQEAYKPITLTELGIEVAKKILYKHHLLKEFLMTTLEIDEAIAEKNACEMEHIVCDEFVKAIEKKLNR